MATNQVEMERMERNLSLQPPKDDLVKMRLERLRADAKNLATSVISNSPDCRERSLALTRIEEALAWAIGAVVRNQND